MFGLLFFILFAPGLSEFLCTSSDLEMSYTFCDSTAHIFMFNLTPCSTINKPVWKAALTWIPKDPSLFEEREYHQAIQVWQDFYKESACSRSWKWYRILCANPTVIFKPSFKLIVFNVWYDGAKALLWKELLCSGADDEYSVCGTLKGETLVTEFDIKGSRTEFPKGNYNVIVQGFSDDSENNVVICLNFTMIVKRDAF